MLTEKDIQAIIKRGSDPEVISEQLRHFQKGFPFAELTAPATKENGLCCFNEQQTAHYEKLFSQSLGEIEVLKFVPASGAASRMFSHLYTFRDALNEWPGRAEELTNDPAFKLAAEFIAKIEHFAFYPELKECMQKAGMDIDVCREKKDYATIINFLLNDEGLGYSNLPKALLSFHKYPDGARKAVEEHLVEGALYCVDSDKKVHIHFTLSPEHISRFNKRIAEVVHTYEEKFGIRYVITHSIQEAYTDTIAVDMDNKPFRDADGSLVFRPGGHGALIANLNAQNADIVFIKNIDNIVPDHLKPQTVTYKKVIGGLLLELQEQCFTYLDLLDDGNLNEREIEEITEFCNRRLMINIPETFWKMDHLEQIDFLYDRLNRPMRVCGMVKNEGEPGGGPFLVRQSDGEISLQIVESSQIDLKAAGQHEIFQGATHFNPVDLVCSLKDFNGNKFDLTEFVDPETGFISVKTKDGRQLKALELPGLWNGAMAHWITIFVEVPIITFNPVKTVNDLLIKEHQCF